MATIIRGYDPACEELAAHFLSDVEADCVPRTISAKDFKAFKAGLSQKLQDAAEDWLNGMAAYFNQKRRAGRSETPRS